MEDGDLALGSGYPAADEAKWRALAERALKGQDLESALTSHTFDGLAIKALYRRSDRPALAQAAPGDPPFLRGGAASGTGWDIRTLQATADPRAANEAILEDLAGGATSLLLQLDHALARGEAEPSGILAYDQEAFDAVLEGVALEAVRIMLDAGPFYERAAETLFGLAHRRGLAPPSLHADLGADPIGAVARGELAAHGALEPAMALAMRCDEAYPDVRTFFADGGIYHASGASEAQEIAAAIATGILYLRGLSDAGLPVERAARQILFGLTADADLFLTVAKIRAFRRLWSQVLESSRCEPVPAVIHATTASRMMTRRDPYVNVLRTTSAAFAAGIAGASSISVLPMDHALAEPDRLARRLARNSQLILMEESGVHRVADPVGGSYHVERLSEDLAAAAWPMVQAIEGEGGMLAALRQSMVQDVVASSFIERLDAIAHRRLAITGVSSFPHLEEPRLRTDDPPHADLIETTRAALSPEKPIEVIAATLMPTRLAEGFERLRDLSDLEQAARGARPRVFLANMGSLAEHSVRSSYAAAAFAAGGIEAVEPGPLNDVQALRAAFEESGCRIACLCGPDRLYHEDGQAWAKALGDAGAQRLYLAGTARLPGIDERLHEGCNLLELLEEAHSLLSASDRDDGTARA